MGRQILDASLIANEVLKKWALGPSGWDGCGVVSPLLNSPFLLMECQLGFFPSTRGLRQGDPLPLTSLLWEWRFWTSLSGERWRGKNKGGLGLRRIATLNRALLGKWIWRFACEKNNFWNTSDHYKIWARGLWLEAKEGPWAAGVGVWKEIMKESDWCGKIWHLVGKGSKIKFWKDSWCTDTPLSQCFNQLFVLAVHRDATIEEMWDQIRAKEIGSLFL
ncbi:hypothetical protein CK203_043512 [Vitis vinifera]|uniref:Uncharacterized protein n=1 Tax=Vitis vinifera TaxID=29760 RepID=A0A438HRB7_VITVI|nr:hypothetical protein CK203_043512 [Vitis vinifera]